MAGSTITAGGCAVGISKADKVLFSEDGITRLDLAGYWAKIARTALPHYSDRPLTMRRFPDGIGADGFFQKDIPDHFPGRIAHAGVPKEGGSVPRLLANDAATLAYLADQGCIGPRAVAADR